MSDTHPIQLDRWRIVVARRNASEILVLAHCDGFGLPEVLVPRNQRLAWHLNDQMKWNWQLRILSIVPINGSSKSGGTDSTRYHLAELVSPQSLLPPGTGWVKVGSVGRGAFQDGKDFDTISALFTPSSRCQNEDGPFSSVGWFQDLSVWIRDVAAARRLEWNGQLEQFHAAASFSLIRLEASPRVLWFKAVGEPNTREFCITRELAHRLPKYVPQLVAVRPECNGWLAEECSGTILDDVFDLDLWREAAGTLAQLQIESVPHAQALLNAGAHPLPSVVSTGIEQFVRAGATLFCESRRGDAPELTAHELEDIALQIRGLFASMTQLEVPDALGHLDLNAGNVIVSAEHCAYLDWAEAYVGAPFLSFEYLLQAFRRKFGRESPGEALVTDAYLNTWERVLPRNAIRKAWALTPPLALFVYAVRCISASEEYFSTAPSLAKYVRSLLRRLKRELGNCRPQAIEVQR